MTEFNVSDAPTLPEGYFYRIKLIQDFDSRLFYIKASIRRPEKLGSVLVSKRSVNLEHFNSADDAALEACRRAFDVWVDSQVLQKSLVRARELEGDYSWPPTQ